MSEHECADFKLLLKWGNAERKTQDLKYYINNMEIKFCPFCGSELQRPEEPK